MMPMRSWLKFVMMTAGRHVSSSHRQPRTGAMLTSEALVLLAQQVLDGHLDVLEGDVSCTAGPDTLAVHATSADTTEATLNKQNGNTVHALLAGTDRSGEVIGPWKCQLL